MKYALLIYGDETSPAVSPPQDSPEFAELIGGYMAFGEEAGSQGKIVAGEALHDTDVATTVTVVDGETVTTDGPFAETKEQLGGFYILECADLDEAIAWAAKIPTAKTGRIEVRPVQSYDDEGQPT